MGKVEASLILRFSPIQTDGSDFDSAISDLRKKLAESRSDVSEIEDFIVVPLKDMGAGKGHFARIDLKVTASSECEASRAINTLLTRAGFEAEDETPYILENAHGLHTRSRQLITA